VRYSPYSIDRQDLSHAPIAARDGETTRAISRRFHRGIGFWFGGIILGVGGCLFGASMPYHHPVGVLVSVLWWGLYFGCFGASIGALLGLWAEQYPARPSQEEEGVGEVTCPTALPDDGGFVNRVKRATHGNPERPPVIRRANAPGR
jgi:hypothetical protein